MCGINGVYHYRDRSPADPGLVERQATSMRHRGPDSAAVWHDGPVALGHRRLAIVDLSPGGHQPMPNEDESLWVTYNGELYGWPEIRGVLATRGHRFRGTSDTEAILHLYEEHGDGLLEHLRGMFAFALWDRRRERMVIARDRLGIKPLYWHDDGRRLVFASELKALMLDPSVPRDVDTSVIPEFLVHQYIHSPRTIWQGVHKLPPGHVLTCDRNGINLRRYWTLPVEPDSGHDETYYRERLRALLSEAVRLRLVADVPLGAFLSGGIDSSVVVALMSEAVQEPIRTFSIGFEDEDVSELHHARRVARHLGTDHREYVVKPSALELLPRLMWAFDEPFADSSIIPTYYVSEIARREVTVALSGDGGDEAYAGYTTYPWAQRYARADRVPRALRRAGGRLASLLHPDHALARKLRRLSLGVLDRHLDVRSYFAVHELDRVCAAGLRSGRDVFGAEREHHRHAAAAVGDVPALLHADAMTYMIDDVLVKVDRASMQHSLEVRVPLLDHKLLEFVARIPFEYKLRGGVSKWILKESVRDLLPPETLARGKQGFGVPIARWFRGELEPLARDILLDRRARERGWIDPAGVEALLADGALRAERRALQAWTLVCLELWARTWVDRPRERLGEPAEPLRRMTTSDRGDTAAA